MIEKEKIKAEFLKLLKSENKEDIFKLFQIFSNFLLQTIVLHQKDPVKSESDSYAKIICQMIWTKTLALRGQFEGITFVYENGTKSEPLIDPTLIGTLIRNLYEMVGLFNLIFRYSKSEEEKLIVYNLWAISGYKYSLRMDEILDKKTTTAQKEIIVTLENEIKKTSLFSELKNKEKIDYLISKKKYLIRFDNKEIKELNWSQLLKTMGIKNMEIFNSIYPYFSLYSHPTYISVVQFSSMYNEEERYKIMANVNLKYLFILLGIFISDYIHCFPSVINTYNNFNEFDRIVINLFNVLGRDKEYSIV